MSREGQVHGFSLVEGEAGCAFALACVLPCAWTPGAFAADDGRWPVANDVVAAAWKQGIDGSGVKVAVLDSQAVEDYPRVEACLDHIQDGTIP